MEPQRHPDVGAGTGTAPGVRHRDMHPLTKRRVDAQADVGRRIAAYGEACVQLGRKRVTAEYVSDKRAELNQGLAILVEAAQNEGEG
jgi:hypothetical protein